MSFLDAVPIVIQIIHDRDEMSRKKALRLSKRRYWPYRAIAAGNLVGEDYSAMIEVEQDPRVARQLAWNYEATPEQLDRYGWKLNYNEYTAEDLIAVLREFNVDDSRGLENLEYSDLVDLIETI
jgi:hypothetical protein